jgi:hypothetical protein
MWLIRVRGWLARALLPLMLLALATLLHPLSEDSTAAGCMYAIAMRDLRHLGRIDTHFENDVHLMVDRAQWSAGMAHDHFWYVACLLVAFATAYLVLARERLALRVSVSASVIVGGFVATFVFGSLC